MKEHISVSSLSATPTSRACSGETSTLLNGHGRTTILSSVRLAGRRDGGNWDPNQSCVQAKKGRCHNGHWKLVIKNHISHC